MNKKQMMVLTTTRQKALGGDAAAQLRLGRLYAKGEIVEADPVHAYVWLTRAADQHAVRAGQERDAIAAAMSPADLERARALLAGPLA
ncbi:MAG: SEL1-like repeat protein [Pseudomonadota bacterium]